MWVCGLTKKKMHTIVTGEMEELSSRAKANKINGSENRLDA